MKSLVIYTHPWDGSFNHHVLEKTLEKLKEKGNVVDLIDLHQDGFNPAFTADDLKVFGKGEYHDALAANYVERLKATDEVIFIFPVWWYGVPAMLKGFMDKVFLKGHAYEEVDHKLSGLLDINKAAVFTTANITKEIFALLGDPVEKALIGGIFNTVGISNVSWVHCKTVHDPEARAAFLDEIDAYFEN